MGQEASLPQDADDLEEQAKAPPSVPQPPAARLSGRKLMSGKLFHRNDQPLEASQQRAGIMYNGEDDDPNAYGTPPAAAAAPAPQPVVGVMYEKTKKAGLGKVASGRGAAIINSMRNLSLGVRNQSAKKGVNDWEKQWDEDEDESDGEEEELEEAEQTAAPLHPIAAVSEDDDGLEWDTAGYPFGVYSTNNYCKICHHCN